MPSLPLELHQVLEEEYVSMYGPLPRPAVTYDEKQILDAAWARIILRGCAIKADRDPESIARALSELVETDAVPSHLAKSPALTERGRLMLDQYAELRGMAEERDGADGPRELRRTIVDNALGGAVKHLRDIRLDRVYSAIHARANDPANPRPRTALCISGGGIRSATFALGVIQGLASAEVLKRFDYLSTVSGGGYIGSWLSSWVRRHPRGVAGVERDLQRVDTGVAERAPTANAARTNLVQPSPSPQPPVNQRDLPDSKLNPEPMPLRHLRAFSNYMSPRLGLFSADSWTIGSLYLRNLLLNLLVLVPILALALATPRLFSWGLEQRRFLTPLALPWIAVAALAVAFAYIGRRRPVQHAEKSRRKWIPLRADSHYFLGCIVPLGVASYALSIFWARSTELAGDKLLTHPSTFAAGLTALLAMTFVPFLLYYVRLVRSAVAARRSGFLSGTKFVSHLVRKAGSEFFSVSVAVLASAVILWLLAEKVFPTPLGADLQFQFYVCFAVPAVLLVFFVQASIFVGLSSRKNEDSDREWWGRAGAWLLITALGLAAFSAIAVFGPVALYNAPILLGSIGGIAGIAATVLGFSDTTPANQKQKEAGGKTAAAGNLASALMVPLFVLLVLAVISLGSTWILQELGPPQNPITAKTDAAIAKARADAHLSTIRATQGRQLLGFAGLAFVAVLLSYRIGVNKFSMHALYRNRLIRAYLGASRYVRGANAFTGFDENDNVHMWELRQELLWRTGFRNMHDFVALLRAPAGDGPRETMARHIWSTLDERTRTHLDVEHVDGADLDALVQNLNHLVMKTDLTVVPGAPAPAWIADDDSRLGYTKAFCNRAVLDHYFARWIRPMPAPDDVVRTPPLDSDDNAGANARAPMHIVNAALNLTNGENLAWQQRKAESFTISPLHTGSLFLGYRSSHQYGGPRGISLGTAVTISGAAASPNMGYHSSPAMAFLLTLFNVRLGSWLGNPGLCGQKSYEEAHPRTNLSPLIAEATGSSNDRSPWVYLSDGGHFENLGLYEMVLRRCHMIVLSDAGADPKFSFEDLGNAIRKIRTDLGVPIDIENMCMAPRSADGKFGEGRYVARATIRYSAVDAEAKDGTLIYIKAGVYDDPYFPRDVYNYAQESMAFPHEPTSDQFFSESQFESYRALGRHAVNDICGNYPAHGAEVRIPIAKTFDTVAEFVAVAKDNTGPRVRP